MGHGHVAFEGPHINGNNGSGYVNPPPNGPTGPGPGPGPSPGLLVTRPALQSGSIPVGTQESTVSPTTPAAERRRSYLAINSPEQAARQSVQVESCPPPNTQVGIAGPKQKPRAAGRKKSANQGSQTVAQAKAQQQILPKPGVLAMQNPAASPQAMQPPAIHPLQQLAPSDEIVVATNPAR